MKALEGVRVLDLTHAYNGPFATMWLADNGAEVIKIEPPSGDECRSWGPIDEKSGESGFFAYLNRNKKGITLNLKDETALKLFYEMVKDADVVVENYKFGTAQKLKVDYETLRSINPGIIYASGSGFGQTGPNTARTCYDGVAQAMSGYIHLNGHKDRPPCKVGAAVGDNCTGTFLALGIVMALFARERTGVGQQVDVAMVDTLFSLLENAIPLEVMTDQSPSRNGSIDLSIAPFDVYECSDGYVAFGCGNDSLFRKLCGVIGKPELAEDELYVSNVSRGKNYEGEDRLQGIIGRWCRDKSKFEIDRLMSEAGVPCGPVLSIEEAIESPQIQERGMMIHVDHPTMGDQYQQGFPIKLSETPASVKMPSPLLGEHTQEILGLSDEEMKDYKKKGII